MNMLGKLFLKGLAVVIPVTLTLAILWWFARTAERFRGEAEPIDPVAGHIPGAINAPYTDFVHPDGTWRDLEERKQLLEKALGDRPRDEWSVMCGSGVTACHLAISALEAGFREPRVYVGSWSEWIRGGRRPIAGGGT